MLCGRDSRRPRSTVPIANSETVAESIYLARPVVASRGCAPSSLHLGNLSFASFRKEVDQTMNEVAEFLENLKDRVGSELGATAWFTINQTMADGFGRLTGNPDPMRNDPK